MCILLSMVDNKGMSLALLYITSLGMVTSEADVTVVILRCICYSLNLLDDGTCGRKQIFDLKVQVMVCIVSLVRIVLDLQNKCC